MIEAMPGRALRRRGALAVFRRVIRRVIGFDASTPVRGVLGVQVSGILRFLALLAAAAGPTALQSGEKGVRALRHRGGVTMLPMLMRDPGVGLFTAS